MGIRLSVFISHVDAIVGDDPAALVDLAVALEDAGADQVVLSEHVVLAGTIEAHGPGGAPFPFPPQHHYPEPLVSLAAIAGATTRLGLATGILIAPLRPAVVLAKMAATLDVLSRGRFELGVGAGWHAAELRAAGVDAERPTRALEDTIGACRALWTGGPSSFASTTVTFDDLYCRPVPTRGAALSVWMAGPCAPSTFRRIARLGDGWLPFSNVAVDDIRRAAAMLRAAAIDAGRDPDSLGIRASVSVGAGMRREQIDAVIASAAALVDAGATAIQLPLARLASDLDQAQTVVSEVADAVHALRR